MPIYKLTLTDEEGVLLDAWKIDPTGDANDDEACNLRKSMAQSWLISEIHDAVETAQADREADR